MSELSAEPGSLGRLVIRVGARRFAIELAQVEGVATAPPVSPVPGTPRGLLGLINQQGTILPAIDADPNAAGERRHVVLLRTREFGRFALLCDWVEDLAAPGGAAQRLDAEALARQIVAAYETTPQRPPLARAPVARILLRPDVTPSPDGRGQG